MAVLTGADMIITPFELFSDRQVHFSLKETIKFYPASEKIDLSKEKKIDCGGKIITPGFIDIHTHGGNGIAFGSGDLEEGLLSYSRWVASAGVTGFLLSISGPNPGAICNILSGYASLFQKTKEWPGAKPLGIHLEGPYLNPKKHGAFQTSWLRQPSIDELKNFLDYAGGWIRQVSLAPELDGAMEAAAFLEEAGVIAALGHSNADYNTASAALKKNFKHVTHAFNAQSGFHHRSPGVVGAVLASDEVTAELIGDKHHIHPAVMKILYRCLGPERVILITDAMPGTGLPDGVYNLLGMVITVNKRKATLPDGTLAGSTATMDSALRILANQAEIPLPDAIRMATYNPAKCISQEDKIGHLADGKTADITVLNGDLSVYMTIASGKIVFKQII